MEATGVVIRRRSLTYRLAMLSNPHHPPETTCKLKLKALDVLCCLAILLSAIGLPAFLAYRESWFSLKLMLGASLVGPLFMMMVADFIIIPFHLDRYWETRWEALKLQPWFLAIKARFCKKAVYI